ncbi:larval cuticle protein A2B-like [Anopheles darlingi]|uniref:larval cuticle protein A2B-like n=1 Tax=Anopheles darlingi TaxID=43151 RepID=UPI00210017BF|nr:larval cuticle protein A2B-like [Anopheles darlingi]
MLFKIVACVGILVVTATAQSHYGLHNEAQHDAGNYHHDTGNYHHDEDHHGPAHYEYHYDVHDEHTGDVHGHREARKDDSTHGEYYLIDADGHKRTVKYHVEGKSGFIAEVHREAVKGFHDAPERHNYHHKFE